MDEDDHALEHVAGLGEITFRAALIFVISCTLCACGTYVPEIEEFWGTPDDVGIKVNAITSQVECELRESVRSLLAADAKLAKESGTKPQLTFLMDWAAQVTLTLTILESTALSARRSRLG